METIKNINYYFYRNLFISFRDNLQPNITIYKSIKNMFMEYSAPYASQNIRRNTNKHILYKIRKLKGYIMNTIYYTKLNLFIKNGLLNRL